MAEGGKLAARATVSKSPPCENYHSMRVCFPGTTGGGTTWYVALLFRMGVVGRWQHDRVGRICTWPQGSLPRGKPRHGFACASSLAFEGPAPAAAKCCYYLYCAWLVKTCRPHFCFFISFYFLLFNSSCFFPSSLLSMRLLLPPQSSSIRTPSCGRPSHPLFFYPPVSAKRSNTWPWLGVAPSHDAAPPPVLQVMLVACCQGC